MIVSCANCGKRFKGSPGSRKFKCSGCGNLFTFPEIAMAPADDHILCSNCWSEMKANPDLRACPMCSQKLSHTHGGKAVEESTPPQQQFVPQQAPQQQVFQQGQQQDEQEIRQEPQSAINQDIVLQHPGSDEQERLVQDQPSLRQARPSTDGDDGAYRARAEQAEAKVRELEEQMNEFREVAINALSPLVPEVNRLMQALSDEVAQILTLVSQARQHLQATAPPPERMMGLSELQKLESAASEMQGRVEAIRTALTSRLQDVLGEPEDAPAP